MPINRKKNTWKVRTLRKTTNLECNSRSSNIWKQAHKMISNSQLWYTDKKTDNIWKRITKFTKYFRIWKTKDSLSIVTKTVLKVFYNSAGVSLP